MHSLLGPAAVVAAATGLVAAGDRGPVLCPFRLCTGGYCPGCGLTRAAGRLARGDVAGAWQHHPFLVVAAVEAAVLAGAWAAWRRRQRQGGRGGAAAADRCDSPAGLGLAPWTGPWRSVLALVNLGVLVAIWAARLALGAIPAPFS